MLEESSLEISSQVEVRSREGRLKSAVALSSRISGKVRSIIVNLLKASITLGLLYFLYSKGMLSLSPITKLSADLPIVVAAFLAMSCTLVASIIRWRMLLKGQKLSLSFLQALRLTMIGVFFNTTLPGAVSGDLIKGYYVMKLQADGHNKIRAFTSILIDRMLGLSGLICVSFIVMVANLHSMMASPILKSLCGLIAALWFGVVLFYSFVLINWPFSKKIPALLNKLPAGRHFSRVYEAVKSYENCRHYIFIGLLISIGIHTTLISIILMLASALGGFAMVAAVKFYLLVPLGLLVTAIPIAPAGVGTGHAAFEWLFHLVGSVRGADLFTAYLSFQVLMSLIGGIFYLRYRSEIPATLSEPDINTHP